MITIHRYIASDCDAVAIMHDVQGYSKLPEDAVASVIKAGNLCIVELYLYNLKSYQRTIFNG